MTDPHSDPKIPYMEPTLKDAIPAIETTWVVVAAVLVMFMQVGFLFLEVGFSRMKNAGTVVPKILANFSIAALCYWAVGFALAFGGAGWFAGTEGTFLGTTDPSAFPAMEFSQAAVPAKFFFQFVFCAVSLAIVWGTTIERIKFGAYLIYAVVFSALIYPIISHWIFGGGWLQANFGMQDFAGSTVVHLIGATGALAALLLLGPRHGKYGDDGKPNAIPGHNMPLVGLAVLVLWFGWFGFNAGSTLGAIGGRFADVVVVTQLGAAAGVLGAMLMSYLKMGKFDMSMTANGAIAALVAITAPSGYVEFWAAPLIGFVAGVIVVTAVLAELNAIGDGGLFYTGSAHQLLVQGLGIAAAFASVFSVSFVVFYAIKKTYGLRVEPEEERYGLDIVEHGMWGYPEAFMPVPGSEYRPPAMPKGWPPRQPAPVTMAATRVQEG
jgi:ammonium transporter, Amt family